MLNIILSILAGLGFGCAMFLRKVSVTKIGMSAYIIEAFFGFIIALMLIPIFFGFNSNNLFKSSGSIYALVGGLIMGLGIIAFFRASQLGSVTIPALIAPALGSIVTIILAFIFLKDSLSLIKIVGLIITIFGLYLFSK